MPALSSRHVQPLLIIGATSSVAAIIARLYARRGEKLVLVARDATKLATLANELGQAVVGMRVLDFTHHAAIADVVASLYEDHGEFRLALLAHGYLGDQRKSEEDFEEAYKQLSVNYVSALAWLIPLSGRMETRGKGHIAAITSVAGDRGRPRNYTYGSAKGGLGLYMQGLRSRLWGRVAVTTIKLGPVDTPMTVDHEKNASFITSEQAAQRIVHAIDRKKQEVYVPRYWRPILWAVRVMPEALFQRIGFLSGR